MKKRVLWELFVTFFKIGAFTFGGGYAMIPLISRETVEKKHWVSDEDILEIIAIAESTPGPIAINSSTFVGYRTAGFWGAFSATVGMVLPSFVMILALSYVLDAFRALEVVRFAFEGIRAGVLALIVKALWSMYKKVPKSALSYVLMTAAFVCAAFLKVPVLLVIVACALCGLAAALLAQGRDA